MKKRTLGQYIKEIVSILSMNYPEKYAQILGLADNQSWIVRVERETVRLRINSRKGILVTSSAVKASKKRDANDDREMKEGSNTVILSFSKKRIISDLVEGIQTVLEMTENPDVEIRGDLGSLEAMYKTLEVGLGVAPSSPAMITLFHDFKAQIDKEEKEEEKKERIYGVGAPRRAGSGQGFRSASEKTVKARSHK